MPPKRKSSVPVHERADEHGVLAAIARARRVELGLRQDELAELAGCSSRFVHALETGKPTVQLDKVLDVLGVLGLHFQIERGVRPGGVEAAPEILAPYDADIAREQP
jgi:y4mF family transcriptional regulator